MRFLHVSNFKVKFSFDIEFEVDCTFVLSKGRVISKGIVNLVSSSKIIKWQFLNFLFYIYWKYEGGTVIWSVILRMGTNWKYLLKLSHPYSLSVYINVSSVVEFQRWWVLKCKIFSQESTRSKENVLKKSCNELWFVKKCLNRTFKVNFLCQKSMEFFQNKISI